MHKIRKLQTNSRSLVGRSIGLPSQHNKDYKNDSSKYDASVFLAVSEDSKHIII